jgi:hypothetical protein
MGNVLDIALALGSIASAVMPGAFLAHLPHLRQLADERPVDPEVWPRVSTIVPARNEADRIVPALESRLADDYPDLEIIFIDDRSDDATGEGARTLAAHDPRLQVLRIDELPAGWLGKVHALDKGVARASGEWLLFSDADVHVTPGSLKTTVAIAIAENLDCVAVIPAYETGAVLVDALWAHFLVVLGALLDPAAIARADSRASLGSGAFTLVRRSAFARTEGFEHLRLETGDDTALAQMLKHAGARCAVLGARGRITVAVYRSVAEFLRGIEKNGSTTLGPPFAVLAGGLGLAVAMDYVPFVALGAGAPWVALVGAAALLIQTAAHCAALYSNTGAWLPGLAWPIGTPLMAFGLLRSAWLVRRRGGVLWRGTFYPNDELLAARRYKL